MKTSFIKTSIKLLMITLFIGAFNMSNAQDRLGGLALYTVRNEMVKDAKATLQAVADAGYKNIEAAGYRDGKYYNMTPDEFKSLLKSLKLKPISTHQAAVTLDNADQMFTDAKAAGFEYFVVPIPPMGLFKFFTETQSMGMTGGAVNLANILEKN